MSDPKTLIDPGALLRRLVAAYDALEAARIEQGDDPTSTRPAEQAFQDALEEARRAVKAPQPWRRETSRRKARRG